MVKTSLAERWPTYCLYTIIFLIPLAFWPSQYLIVDGAKKYPFLILVTALAISFVLSRWSAPTLVLPSRSWLLAFSLPVVTALIAGLLSGAPYHSLIGLGVENDTVWALLFWFLFGLLAALVWLSRPAAGLYLPIATLGLGTIIALFQWAKLLLGNFTFLEVFTNPAANLIGRWNEFGLFMGLVTVLALAFLTFLPWRRTLLLGLLAWFSLVLGLVSLLIVNYWYAWLLVGLSALLLLLVRWFRERGSDNSGQSTIRRLWFVWPLIIVILAGSLIIFGNQNFWPTMANRLGLAARLEAASNWLGVEVLEVSPSWLGTGQVAWGALKESPLIGAGPNKFSNAWFKHRPASVNGTVFWALNFDYGVGFLPNWVVTMGGLGIIALVLLLGIFGYYLFKVLFGTGLKDNPSRPLLSIVAFGTLYLLVAAIVYPVGTVLLVYLFAFAGLFVAMITNTGLSPTWEIKLRSTGSAVTTWVLSAGGVIGLIIILLLVQNLVAAIYFSRAIVAINRDGDLNNGEVLLARATGFNRHDLFYRSLVEVELGMLNGLLQNQTLDAETAQTSFQNILAALVDNSRRATEYNPTNYLNWQYKGQVFESLVPLEIEGATEAGREAYNQARLVSSDLPSVLLALARLEAAAGNQSAARDYLTVALAKKPNYTEAIFVLAQLEANSGNLQSAINFAETASVQDPANPTTWFAVGLLKYQAGSFGGAREALEQAVALNPSYANARYFLGLAYDRLGFKTKALEQFRTILATNDLAEIRQIIVNLEAGRAALAETEPPAPEDREALPVEDDN